MGRSQEEERPPHMLSLPPHPALGIALPTAEPQVPARLPPGVLSPGQGREPPRLASFLFESASVDLLCLQTKDRPTMHPRMYKTTLFGKEARGFHNCFKVFLTSPQND